MLANWNPNYSIETILSGLRNQMASHQNRKMAQPPEGKAHFAYQALVILPVLIYDRMFRTFVC